MADAPLPLPTYARALAHMTSRRDQPIENILGALGITAAQLHAADAHYNEALRAAYRRRKGVLAMQFAEAFAQARHELGLLGGPPPPAPAPAPPAADARSLPSYLHQEQAAVSWSSSAAPAHTAAPPPAVATPPAAPAAAPPPAHVVVTPPAAAAAPPPPGFGAPPPGFGAGPPATTRSGLQGTADLPLQAVASPAVPFRPAATPPLPASTPPLPASASAATPPAAPPGPGTGTRLATSDGPRPAETPWDETQTKQRVGKLTVAHFAALTIEMSRHPADPSAVLRRYGLSSQDDLRHVTAAFQAQMSVDPAMKAQFDATIARMRSMSARRET